jgi:large subunit ribosomal protein L18
VYRSLRHIFAQIIDDKTGKTLVSASDVSTKASGTKSEVATIVGKAIAELAVANKIEAVRFDRGGYKYHGRVAALAEGARQNGLTF